MKELEKFLSVLSDGMKALAQGVESLAEKVDELAKSQGSAEKPAGRKTPKRTPKKAAKKPAQASKKKGTATDTVFAIIKRSKKGVDTATLKKKTGYEDKKIHNIIYKLKKKGLIKAVKKGVYAQA